MKKLKAKIYESYFTSHYASLDQKQNEVELLKNSTHGKQYLDFIPSNHEIKIIDLGCGTGSLVSGLKNCGYKNVSGVDVSLENIQQAKLAELDLKHGEIIAFLDEAIEKITNLYFLRYQITLIKLFIKLDNQFTKKCLVI